MNELFVGKMRAASAARIASGTSLSRRQATKLMPVMTQPRRNAPSIARVAVPLLAAVLAFVSLPQARASSVPGQESSGSNRPDEARAIHAAFDGISLDEAVSRAERQYRARVVRTDVQDEDGRKVYVLKLLSEDGRVFTVRIDAATGGSR